MANWKRLLSDARLWLMGLGLIAILTVDGMLASALTGAVSGNMLKGEAQIMQEFLGSALAAEGSAAKLFATPAPSPELTSFAAHVRSLPGTVRANIYSPDLFIRYSTDANLVGVQFDDNPELVESFAGEVVSELETVSSDSKTEHLALNQLGGEKLIESYIPVKDGTGKVVTVVEFYRKATAVEATMDSVSRRVWIAAAVNAAVLILGMAAAIMLGKRRPAE
jgi:hypothetical protein